MPKISQDIYKNARELLINKNPLWNKTEDPETKYLFSSTKRSYQSSVHLEFANNKCQNGVAWWGWQEYVEHRFDVPIDF